MSFDILYYPEVKADDIPLLPANIRARIQNAIEERLTTLPERYGFPLRNTLKGYWKLRVGDYRVVYKIKPGQVLVYGIMHRKYVYERILRRVL